MRSYGDGAWYHAPVHPHPRYRFLLGLARPQVRPLAVEIIKAAVVVLLVGGITWSLTRSDLWLVVGGWGGIVAVMGAWALVVSTRLGACQPIVPDEAASDEQRQAVRAAIAAGHPLLVASCACAWWWAAPWVSGQVHWWALVLAGTWTASIAIGAWWLSRTSVS